jgi:cephalosporin hydroxylase
VRAWIPAALLDQYRTAHLVRRARKLGRLAERAGSVGACCGVIEEFPEFRPYQQREELVAFLDRAVSLCPVAVCEIGAASGGTLCALAHVSRPSIMISVDIDFTTARLRALPRLGRSDQTIACIAGDSHSEPVRARVEALLGGRRLDLLFIDGDHSYEGVRRDFESYSPLVRAGGLIAFHDIVPDFRTRFGTHTSSDSGGVPAFWQELARRFPHTDEIVASPEQDGYGIGLLTWPG